jgi:hypothetical protein
MREQKEQFIDQTVEIWQPRTSKVISHEDARQITENVTGFFEILVEWDKAEQHTPREIAKTETKTAFRRPERLVE